MLSCHQLFSETSCPNTTMLIYHTECNLKRLIPKKEQYYMKNGTGNTNPTIIEKDIRLIDEMIFFAEEFDNTILNISETEVIDLDEVDEIIQKEKLNK